MLSSKVGLSHDHAIKGGNPSQCEEAALALRHGKSVRELRLAMDLGDAGLFHMTLTGDDLSPRNVQLPEARDDVEASPIEQRLRSSINLTNSLDHLIEKFMQERSAKHWESDGLTSIRTWIKERTERFTKQRDGAVH